MKSIPRERIPDSTVAMAMDPYRFISRRCEAHGSDIFSTRVMLGRAICLRGADAGRLFYDPASMRRTGAAPRRIRRTLFGEGGVQGLDGGAHQTRKQLFMSLMTPSAIGRLAAGFRTGLLEKARGWQGEQVVLLDEVHEILARAVAAWVGIPLDEDEVRRRTSDLVALFESPGTVGPPHWRGRRARRRSERWLSGIVERLRSGDGIEGGRPSVAGSSEEDPLPVSALAWHRDERGLPLPPRVAAVELLNLLRPTVAVGRFIVFEALALHTWPEAAAAVEEPEADRTEWFVQEVRRFYPFFPATIARVRPGVEWRGYALPAGARALYDLYGTNHDPRLWDDPEVFRPERFRSWTGDPYRLVPQGAGDHLSGHRCPGEWITIELMKQAASALRHDLRYDVPKQDLTVGMRRAPARPRSGFVIEHVRVA